MKNTKLKQISHVTINQLIIIIIIIMRTFISRDLNKIPQVRSWLKQILFQFLSKWQQWLRVQSQIGRKIVPNCCSSDCEVPNLSDFCKPTLVAHKCDFEPGQSHAKWSSCQPVQPCGDRSSSAGVPVVDWNGSLWFCLINTTKAPSLEAVNSTSVRLAYSVMLIHLTKWNLRCITVAY